MEWKKKIYIGVLLGLSFSFTRMPERVNIRAVIRGCGEQKVYIMEHNRHNFDYYVVDSVEVRNDSFEISIEDTYPRSILLVFEESREKVIPLYVEEGNISIEGEYGMLGQVKKTGTPTLDLQSRLDDKLLPLRQEMGTVIDSLKRVEEKYLLHPTEALAERGAALSGWVNRLQKQISQLIDSVITENSANILAAALLMNNQPLLDLPQVEALLARLSPDMPDNIYRDRIIWHRDRLRGIQIGKIAPEIELENVPGDTVRLSSLRGKVLLVNFWFSWETRCRESYTKWRELYNRYHSDGFEIFSVSMDNNREDWIRTIQEGNLEGIHVIERTGKYVDRYVVVTLPTTYLLDREGKIVGKNLTVEELGERLAEMFP